MLSDNQIYDAEQQWDSLQHRREQREKRKKIKKCCETCKYLEEDLSVGAAWCENNDPNWTDEEIEKYYENGEDGCPHWKQEVE